MIYVTAKAVAVAASVRPSSARPQWHEELCSLLQHFPNLSKPLHPFTANYWPIHLTTAKKNTEIQVPLYQMVCASTGPFGLI